MTYNEFINSIKESRENKWFEHSECHHIIPRCLGGRDDQDNLIYLTYEEHFLAHKLLHDENPGNRDLACAIALMSRNGEIAAKEFSDVKLTLSKSWSGENNPNYGHHEPLTGEHLRRVKENHVRGENHPYHGKNLSEEHRRKISETRLSKGLSRGENNPMYDVHRYGEDSPHYGHTHSEETKKKISESAKNRPPISEETRKKLSESRRKHTMQGRIYNLVCKRCNQSFTAEAWNTKYCDNCREVVQNA